jgi:hypothetical protein
MSFLSTTSLDEARRWMGICWQQSNPTQKQELTHYVLWKGDNQRDLLWMDDNQRDVLNNEKNSKMIQKFHDIMKLNDLPNGTKGDNLKKSLFSLCDTVYQACQDNSNTNPASEFQTVIKNIWAEIMQGTSITSQQPSAPPVTYSSLPGVQSSSTYTPMSTVQPTPPSSRPATSSTNPTSTSPSKGQPFSPAQRVGLLQRIKSIWSSFFKFLRTLWSKLKSRLSV